MYIHSHLTINQHFWNMYNQIAILISEYFEYQLKMQCYNRSMAEDLH